MNRIPSSAFRGLAAAAALALVAAAPAGAAGTASNTLISNTATVDYEVGGIAQTPVASPPAEFRVDNKIDLVVTTIDAAAVQVIPGSTAQVLSFWVKNTGNTVQDFSLEALDSAVGAFGLTESFDATNVLVRVDDGDGTYDGALDTATWIDELSPDDSVRVFVVADIPATQGDGDVASYDLVATAAAGGGPGGQGADILTDDRLVADDPAVVQTVFADAAGSAGAPTDDVRDGKHSDKSAYQVVTANLVVDKTSSVASDPFNGVTNPKAIPGAIVDYVIDVSNTGSATAATVVVRDAVPTNTAFVVASVATTPGGATVEYSDDNGTTWAYVPTDVGDGSDPAVTDVRVTFASIAAAASAQATLQVLIQ